jgi:hypothetical protein
MIGFNRKIQLDSDLHAQPRGRTPRAPRLGATLRHADDPQKTTPLPV